MEKTGELKTAVSRCDLCGAPATIIDHNDHAYCADHAGQKQAEHRSPPGLKVFAADTLTHKHKK